MDRLQESLFLRVDLHCVSSLLRELRLPLQFFGELGGLYPCKVQALGNPRRNKFFSRAKLGLEKTGDGDALARAVVLSEFSQVLQLERGPVVVQFLGATIPNNGRRVEIFKALNLGLFKCNDLAEGFFLLKTKLFLAVCKELGHGVRGFSGGMNVCKRVVHSGEECWPSTVLLVHSEGGKALLGVAEFPVNILHFSEDGGEEGAIARGDGLNEFIYAPGCRYRLDLRIQSSCLAT